METTELKDLSLTTKMMDATQIASFSLEKLINLSGANNIGPMNISANMSIGINNNIYSNNALAVGVNNTNSTRCYKILEYNTPSKTIKCSILDHNGHVVEVPQEIIGLKYSIVSLGSAENIGIITNYILDIEEKTCTFNVSRMLNISEPSYLYFVDRPDIGSIDFYNTGSLAVGLSCFATGQYSFAQGYNCHAYKYGHATGRSTIASWSSNSEGSMTSALGICTHAEGRNTYASGNIARSSGRNTIASGAVSLAAGYIAEAKDDYSYVWAAGKLSSNGDFIQESSFELFNDSDIHLELKYQSHGNGTYNINPKNEISGFYIGEKSLYQHLKDYTSNLSILPLSGRTFDCDTDDLSSMLIELYECLGGEVINK